MARTADVTVIDGFGFYSMFDSGEDLLVDTPYGMPSAALRIGEVEGGSSTYWRGFPGPHGGWTRPNANGGWRWPRPTPRGSRSAPWPRWLGYQPRGCTSSSPPPTSTRWTRRAASGRARGEDGPLKVSNAQVSPTIAAHLDQERTSVSLPTGFGSRCRFLPSHESAGGLVVVAEGLGDHGRGCLEDELADGGAPARGGRDAEFVDRAGEGFGPQGLAGAATGEQPAGRVVGGGAHVGPLVGVLEGTGRLRGDTSGPGSEPRTTRPRLSRMNDGGSTEQPKCARARGLRRQSCPRAMSIP